jgi:hypothetical protein
MKAKATRPRQKSRPPQRSLTARVTRSPLVLASAAVPVAIAAAEALKEQLPALAQYLPPWQMAVASVGVSTVIAALRIRSIAAAMRVAEDAANAADAGNAKAGAVNGVSGRAE